MFIIWKVCLLSLLRQIEPVVETRFAAYNFEVFFAGLSCLAYSIIPHSFCRRANFQYVTVCLEPGICADALALSPLHAIVKLAPLKVYNGIHQFLRGHQRLVAHLIKLSCCFHIPGMSWLTVRTSSLTRTCRSTLLSRCVFFNMARLLWHPCLFCES